MPAPRGKKRKSNQSTESDDELNAQMTTQKVATKTDDDASGESPRKRRKVNITLAQKQALIDNLQLESKPLLPTIRVFDVLAVCSYANQLDVQLPSVLGNYEPIITCMPRPCELVSSSVSIVSRLHYEE